MAGRASDNWFIDQAVAEYEALHAGGLDVFMDSTAAPDGEIEYCGREEDTAHWTAAYVRTEDEALLPLAVGPLEHVLRDVTRFDRDMPIWDPRVLPPPVVVIDGARRHFRPTRGRFLVGAVTTERRAVLLVAVGESFAVVHLDGASRTVLFRGSAFSFREIDVEGLLGARPCMDQPAPRAVRPSASLRTHHARIVGRLPVDVGDGPAIPEVLWCCFQDLARRAAVVERAHAKQKRKGKTKVEVVVRALYEAGLVGCGNFEGLSGEVLAQLKVFCPGLEIRAEVFADVLRLLLAAKTCVVERPSSRTWRIRLVGLNDPRSPLHRQLCMETAGLYKHDLSIRTANPRLRPPTPPSRNDAPTERAAAPMASDRAKAPHSEPREPPPTSASEPEVPFAGPLASGPAAALAVLLLAVRVTAEARADALARAVSGVEHEGDTAERDVAAEGARLSPHADAPAAAPASSHAVDEPEVQARREASEKNLPPRGRTRPVRPLFATMSSITPPPIGRARPAPTGLPAAPSTEAEPAPRRSTDMPEAVDARSIIAGLLGARGPPVPTGGPSRR